MTTSINFSICIPAFNRERLITRAIASCLNQNGADFEIVVIDDGSSDGTIAAVEAIADQRIRLLHFDTNRGISAARNAAIAAARGEWMVILDSDDELLPGGLDRIREVVESGKTDVDCYEFMYLRDDGGCSPDPPLADQKIDFQDYLRRLDHQRYFDALRCLRRTAALQTPWPEWRVAGVMLHSMELHRSHCCMDVKSDQLDSARGLHGKTRRHGFRRGDGCHPRSARSGAATLGTTHLETLPASSRFLFFSCGLSLVRHQADAALSFGITPIWRSLGTIDLRAKRSTSLCQDP
jgi:hypothetical protein